MAISVLKRGFFNSIFRICRIEVSRLDLNMIFKKSFSGQKTAPPQTPTKLQCTDANLLQLKSAATTLGPPLEEKTSIEGTKGKYLKKKFDFFFIKHFFLNEKNSQNI
jgi:hypothetical protein